MNLELYTKQGIDKAFLMMHFINVIEAEPEKMEIEMNCFKNYIEEQIKRQLTKKEYLNLLDAIIDWSNSEPETTKRINATNYIANAEFLTEENICPLCDGEGQRVFKNLVPPKIEKCPGCFGKGYLLTEEN